MQRLALDALWGHGDGVPPQFAVKTELDLEGNIRILREKMRLDRDILVWFRPERITHQPMQEGKRLDQVRLAATVGADDRHHVRQPCTRMALNDHARAAECFGHTKVDLNLVEERVEV